MEKVTKYSLFLSSGELQTSLNSVVQNNHFMMLTAQQEWSASILQTSGAPVDSHGGLFAYMLGTWAQLGLWTEAPTRSLCV